MEVGLKFVLVVLLLPIVQVLPLEWVNDGQYDYTCSSDSVTELRIAELAGSSSVNATIRLATADEEILPYVSLSCRKSSSKSAFDGDSCDNLILVNGEVFVVEVKVDTITLLVISNHTLQVVVEVNAEIDEAEIDELLPVNLLVLDERKLHVGFATEDMELKDNAIVLRVVLLNKTLSLGADLELRITLTNEHLQEIIRDFSLASDASEHLEEFGDLDPSLVYTAQLSVRNPAQQGRVLLVTPTARLHVALEDVLLKMNFVASNWRALFDKVSNFSDMYQNVFEENVRLRAALLNATNSTPAFEDGSGTTPEVTTVDSETTDVTTADVTTADVTTADVTTADVTTADVTTGVKTAVKAADSATDSNTEESNAYYWLLFAGFVAVLVLCVLGYLLFNRRDKVKVYAVSLWKGAENTGKSSSSKTAGRKYTALPTSIHDTLTHED